MALPGGLIAARELKELWEFSLSRMKIEGPITSSLDYFWRTVGIFLFQREGLFGESIFLLMDFYGLCIFRIFEIQDQETLNY